MALIRVEDLLAPRLPDSPPPDSPPPDSPPSDSPLDAAARFYAEVVPQVLHGGDPVVTLLFAPADHSHRGWREAAVASLARMLAPRRVNAMVGDDDPAAIAATLAFLESSGAMTGQLLPLDSHGAGEVLGCAA